ncbi:MAG: rod shape-determining protein MreD [Bryobacterales bacterium]|nr:rod shape-determining protein MreD [Bryobacterales bacterium]MCZ2146603.1 rod shape-determining protein MreD [Bryobacterales bacterium]
MTEFTDRIAEVPGKSPIARFRPIVFLLTPLAAILFQVYIPRLVEQLAYLDLPLLVTVYFALMRRSPIIGLLLGSGIGLVQDSLSHQPLGMFGIVKTLVGYFCATVSQRFAVENSAIRFILAYFFYFFHQLMYWILLRALLGQPGDFDPRRELILGLLNAAVALPFFRLLDKLRDRG